MEVYEVIFSSPELKTVGDYVSEPGSPASKFINREAEFLAIKNKEGKTNKEVILSRHKALKTQEKYSKLPAPKIPLKIGTKLAIPALDIDRVGLLTQGIEVVSNNIPAFKARQLAELEAKEGYNPARKTKPTKGILNAGVLTESFPEVTVWVWCRALSDSKLHEENKGQIFNITPFVQKVTTNVGKNGGNFQISLPPLTCELDKDSKNWIIKKSSLTTYQQSADNLSMQGDGYVASSSILTEDKQGNIKQSQFLFHNILSPNDLVFIRFETLDLEKQQRIDDNKNFIIDKSQIPGRIYDMIGLIDDNTEIVSGTNNDVTINISGRDLSKLFIEDGTYFYALEMSQGQLNFAGGSTQQNELMQRVFSDNALQYFGLYFNNSIENVLKFVIQQLSTIKVVPNDLFEYYGERRNKKYNPERKQLEQTQKIADQLNQYKQNGIEAITNIRKQAQITNNSQNEEKKIIESVWEESCQFFAAIRDAKARPTSDKKTVTWKSFDYSTSRGLEKIDEHKFPNSFFEKLRISDFYTVDDQQRNLFGFADQYLDLLSANPDHKDIWKEDIANGIWQIIKLVIDDGVTGRRIVDSSASSANGSLLNFIRKICQEPFVEFYMDTYGDMYHLIVRKPPTDKEGFLSMLEGQVTVDGDEGVKKIQSTVVDIEIEDVIQEQLVYDDKNIVSWYHLTPQANFIGNSSTYSLAYLPAIFFQEYADIWGSRPLQVVHNYMPRLPLNAQQTDLDISEKQAYEDIKYLVESNAYMPFTRSGTIVLNGDRRLKVGNICRHKATGEIFFIDDVQQTFQISESSIERTTTIEVSRGMIENFTTGVAFADEKNTIFKTASYFDIINTELVIEEKTVTDTITEQVFKGTTLVSGGAPTPSIAQPTSSNPRSAFKAKIGRAESGGSVMRNGKIVKNPYGSAKGKYQIIDSTWRKVERQVGRSLNIYSAADNELAMDTLLDNYESVLRKAGLNISGTNLYALHFKGTTSWIKAAYQTPNAPVSQYFTAREIHDNPVYMRGGTVGSVIQILAKKMGESTGYSFVENSGSYYEDVYETRTRTITRKEIDRVKVFSNYKVFTECFNFLLRKRQNDINLAANYLKPVVITAKDKEEVEDIANLLKNKPWLVK